VEWARLESNQRPLPYQRSALPPELPARKAPGQGLEPQLPRSERGVLPLRRSRKVQPTTRHGPAPPSTSLMGDRRSSETRSAGAKVRLCHVRPKPTMFSKPLAYPSTLDRRPRLRESGRSSSYVEELWSPSLVRFPKKSTLKHTLIHQRYFKRRAPRVFLSQAGPRFDLELVQAEHHLWFRR
jgi:hypothetical protein